jgi:hypothetical protein
MNDDPARPRLMIIQAMRWTGLVLVVFGLLVITGRAGIDFPREAAYVLVVVGLIDALIMPTVLARRWRSPPP